MSIAYQSFYSIKYFTEIIRRMFFKISIFKLVKLEKTKNL
jgi:hypothetical protein